MRQPPGGPRPEGEGSRAVQVHAGGPGAAALDPKGEYRRAQPEGCLISARRAVNSRSTPHDAGLALFDTPIGPCGIAWSAARLSALALPAASAELTRAHLVQLARRCGAADDAVPPPWVAAVIGDIGALLRGERIGFEAVPLDQSCIDAFRCRVHALARTIPAGATRTYGELAQALGGLPLARAVGQALGANPFPIIVPCHRVLAAQGRPGGFSSPGGLATKLRLLEIERAAFGDTRSLFD